MPKPWRKNSRALPETFFEWMSKVSQLSMLSPKKKKKKRIGTNAEISKRVMGDMSPIYNNCYAPGFCHLTCRLIDKRVPVRSRDRDWISSHSFRLCFLDFLPSVAYSTPVPLSTFICRSFFTRHLRRPDCPLDSSTTIRLEVCTLATTGGGGGKALPHSN